LKLYELAQNYQNLLDLVENSEVPAEMLKTSLQEIEGKFQEKAESICKVIKSIELEAKGIKEEEKRLSDRRKALENNVKNLKEYLDGSMKSAGIKKIKGNIFTLSIQKNPLSVNILDKNSIPSLYKEEIISIKIDKAAIKEILKNGEGVPGARLEQGESLRIR